MKLITWLCRKLLGRLAVAGLTLRMDTIGRYLDQPPRRSTLSAGIHRRPTLERLLPALTL
jgi:hypothetical protein